MAARFFRLPKWVSTRRIFLPSSSCSRNRSTDRCLKSFFSSPAVRREGGGVRRVSRAAWGEGSWGSVSCRRSHSLHRPPGRRASHRQAATFARCPQYQPIHCTLRASRPQGERAGTSPGLGAGMRHPVPPGSSHRRLRGPCRGAATAATSPIHINLRMKLKTRLRCSPLGPLTRTSRAFTLTDTPSGRFSVLEAINCFMAPTSRSGDATPDVPEVERALLGVLVGDEGLQCRRLDWEWGRSRHSGCESARFLPGTLRKNFGEAPCSGTRDGSSGAAGRTTCHHAAEQAVFVIVPQFQ